MREALSVLSQDLSGFNLENYRRIEGHHTLADLGAWVRAMILHMGGAAMPEEALSGRCMSQKSCSANTTLRRDTSASALIESWRYGHATPSWAELVTRSLIRC